MIAMPSTVKRYLAVDLGAESGRVIVGALADDRITLEELHRFDNVPLRAATGLHWNLLLIQEGILVGLRRAGSRLGDRFSGVGVDTWGCDYGLLDAEGTLLGPPFHYRDARTDGLREQAASKIPPEELYRRTGIAQLPFNTIYQLMAESAASERRLDQAATLLQMPDLLHYWLCGERASEITNASTTGALGVDGGWATDLLARLGVPGHMLLTPMQAGATLGSLRPHLAGETNLGPISIIAPPTHDTAAAVVAIPAIGHDHAYISSGTWSLLGVELTKPVVSEAARLAGFTNERGIGGTFRFLTNIMGLWLVQECRRSWARQGHRQEYAELTEQAARISSPNLVIDVDDPAFLHPDDMPAAITAQLERAGLPPLIEPVALTRAILEGLALQYRQAVTTIERLTGNRIHTIHVVGGGSRNTLLCRLTADACGRLVVAGPAEATALGNILAQAMGQEEIRDLQEARALVRAGFPVQEYEPTVGIDWAAREAELLSRRHR